MNRQQSTSISRKHLPENRKDGEREQTEHAALLIASHWNSLKDVDGPAKPGHDQSISSGML
jgi:hypothetical protein